MIAEVDHAVAHVRTLPLQLLEVRYEALVSEPEATLRAVVSFLGLPWHPPMLHPERLERPVATASAQQVRRPIHTGSVGRSAPYAAWLERVPSRRSTTPAITTSNAPAPSDVEGTSPNTTTSSPKPKTGPA